jgi:hypothetical protein
LLVSFKWRNNPAIWLLWLWFLLFPLGSALTNEEVPNEIRAMSGVGLFEIFAALGCWWLWQKLGQFWAKNPSTRFAIGSLGGLVFSVVTLTYLFYTLAIAPTEIRPLFRYGFGETLAAAEEIAPPSAEICVEQTSQSYMLTLFYTRYDPAKYQDFIRNNEPPLKVIYFIPSFDRYRFNCDPTKDLKPGDVGLIRTQTGKLPIRWQIFYPNNRKAWAIVQLP